MGAGLTLIGYWRSQPNDGWPNPADWVDEGWERGDRLQIADYLASGVRYQQYRGYSPCRVCGRQNGSAEFTDWTYVWPEGLAHYVRDHWVRLPEVLLDYIRENLARLQQVDLDSDWWRQVRRSS